MPLSDHEQRLLEQIERALYAEDPKFATSVRSTDLRRHYRRRIVRGAVLFAAGLAVLLGGTITKLVPVGVAGFVLMVLGALSAVSGWTRLSGAADRSAGAGRPGGPSRRRSVVERMEERWKRRRDELGG